MESSFFVCFDRLESWHTEIDKLRTVAVGVSCQVAAVCVACLGEEAWSETRVCMHQRNVTHARHVGLLLRKSALQENFYQHAISVLIPVIDIYLQTFIWLSSFCHGSVIMLYIDKQSNWVELVRWQQTAVLSAQMSVGWRTQNSQGSDPHSPPHQCTQRTPAAAMQTQATHALQSTL